MQYKLLEMVLEDAFDDPLLVLCQVLNDEYIIWFSDALCRSYCRSEAVIAIFIPVNFGVTQTLGDIASKRKSLTQYQVR